MVQRRSETIPLACSTCKVDLIKVEDILQGEGLMVIQDKKFKSHVPYLPTHGQCFHCIDRYLQDPRQECFPRHTDKNHARTCRFCDEAETECRLIPEELAYELIKVRIRAEAYCWVWTRNLWGDDDKLEETKKRAKLVAAIKEFKMEARRYLGVN